MKCYPYIVCTVFLLMAACSSTSRIEYEASENFDPALDSTFAMLPIPNHTAGSASWEILGEDDTSLVYLKSALEARGLQHVNFEQADYLAGVRVVLTQLEGDSVGYNRPSGSDNVGMAPIPNADFGTGSNARIVSRGGPIPVQGAINQEKYRVTLRVEVFDRETRARVWTGSVNSTDGIRFRKRSDVLEAIEDVLSKFPAAVGEGTGADNS